MGTFAAHFITSDDDFIAANRAAEIYAELSKDVADEMSKEIVEGSASKAADAVSALSNAKAAARTLSLFGGKKVVWLRNVNFLSDSFRGRSDELDAALEDFCEFLKSLNPDDAAVVINASPVDRRKRFYKSMQSAAECEDFSAKDPNAACLKILAAQAKKLGVKFAENAVETLAGIVGANSRMAVSELEKLANYVNFERPIEEEDVVSMVPIFGAGDFFDISNAFMSGDLQGALSALRRYFFANKNASARPVITTLQRQNSLLIQLRSLIDAGLLPVSGRPDFGRAREKFSEAYGSCIDEKSSYNIFSQNAWYAGNKLVPAAARFTLKKLLDFQINFARAFQNLIERPGDDESEMRDLFIRCLAK